MSAVNQLRILATMFPEATGNFDIRALTLRLLLYITIPVNSNNEFTNRKGRIKGKKIPSTPKLGNFKSREARFVQKSLTVNIHPRRPRASRQGSRGLHEKFNRQVNDKIKILRKWYHAGTITEWYLHLSYG